MRSLLSVFMSCLMLFCSIPLQAIVKDDPDYVLYYTFADIQMEKNSEDQRYGTNSWHIGWQQLPTSDSARGITNSRIIYLAKNEREGLQVYFFEKGEGRELRLEVGAFLNGDGVELAHEVFSEKYFYVTGEGVTLADALVPYDGSGTVTTNNGQNETFYIEVRSSADQPAGVYYSTIRLFDGDTVLNTAKAAVVVWNFALPEQHSGKLIAGLYNASSGYADTTYFLRQNGVRFDGNTILDEDLPLANAIIEGWQEYLLDHGVMTYELPRYLIDDDPKAAEIAMADIRRQMFFVPLLNIDPYGGSYNSATLAKIDQYKDLIGENDYLVNKAYFYTQDEVDPITQAETIRSRLAAAEQAWPEVKRFISYYGAGGDYEAAMTVLDPQNNVICLNNNMISAGSGGKTAQQIFDDYTQNYTYRWRYPGNILYGSFELYRWGKSTIGMYRRMVFWQQHYMNEDAFLYWNCAYYANNWNIWEQGASPAAGGAAMSNGNGYLVYPGAPIGEDPTVPIASLRLKQINAGIEDSDYLALCHEFMDEEQYLTMVKKLMPNAHGETYWKVFNTEGIDTLAPWEVYSMNSARIEIGNALELAVGEHDWSDWQIVVDSDETHQGVAVRHCLNCGTEESMRLPLAENSCLAGDADCNGVVSFADVTALYMHLIGLEPLSPQGCINADMNQNAVNDYSDVSLLYIFLINNDPS